MYGEGILKGMAVTLKHFFIKPFTIQYPEETLPKQSRFRGYEFVWYEERCTGCASCAKYCPLGIIKTVPKPEPDPNAGDRYHLEVFDIDAGRCMFCGLCVEACPYDALFMGTSHERGSYSRKGIVIHKDELVAAKKQPSAYFRPHLQGIQYGPDDSLGPNEAGR